MNSPSPINAYEALRAQRVAARKEKESELLNAAAVLASEKPSKQMKSNTKSKGIDK